MDKITVKVPATAANLGPGFDCIGMALDLWNELTVESGRFGVETVGEGAGDLPSDSRNLVVTGLEAAYTAAGKRPPDLHYTCINRIPFARGFGSSSAAIVAGLLAGSELSGANLDKHTLLRLAADIEGHPDNVAPAIFGGCCVGVHDGDKWVVDFVDVPDDLNFVAFVPELQINTHESRARLPSEISRADAVYNIGRAALLVNALGNGRLDLLKHATEDRLHQPHRAQAFPAFRRLVKAALDGGACGAFLAGAGPTVLAFASGREVTISYEMAEAARLAQLPGKSMILQVARQGASVAQPVVVK